jgi:hypothetical protein
VKADTHASPRAQYGLVLAAGSIASLLLVLQACSSPTRPDPFGGEVDLTTDCSHVALSPHPCDRSPTRLDPPDLPDLPCPSPAEFEEVQQAVPVRVDSDVSRGTDGLACRAADGSVDLSVVENHVYQSLLFLRRVQFDRPLPWTSRPVFEWVRRTIPAGIVVGSTGNSHSCLGCTGPIHVVYSSAHSLRPTVTSLIASLIVHEARHADGWAHTCGRSPTYFNANVRDRSVSEMGAFGVQYLLLYWIGHHSNEEPVVRDFYRKYAAQILGGGSFCCECGAQGRAAPSLASLIPFGLPGRDGCGAPEATRVDPGTP